MGNFLPEFSAFGANGHYDSAPMKRVLIIGARRTRQGIGEFVARSFQQAGAEIVAVVGSSDATAADAARQLQDALGVVVQSYADVKQACERECPDIVAVCSPHAVHVQHLKELAAVSPLPHVLCEKPMWWQPEADLLSGTAQLIDPFLEAGCVFELVTQWPCTLPGYFQLYPDERAAPLAHFEMLLSPISTSAEAVLDSVPHVLSMLQALVGCGTVENAAAHYKARDRRELQLDFEYNFDSRGGVERPPQVGRVAVRCRFPTCPERPRPAGYGLNHHWVDRTIELPEYTLGLQTPDGRRLSLTDPLAQRVEDFLARVERDPPLSEPGNDGRQALLESVTQLQPLVQVVRDLEETE